MLKCEAGDLIDQMTMGYVHGGAQRTYYLTNVAKTRYYKSSLHQVTGPHVIDQTVGLLTDRCTRIKFNFPSALCEIYKPLSCSSNFALPTLTLFLFCKFPADYR